MPHVQNYLHCVWGTKKRVPFFTPGNRLKIIGHIRSNAKKKKIFIDHVNVYREHMHCLLSLNADQTLTNVVQLIKGEFSHWVNTDFQPGRNFRWADEYFAVSVSLSHLDRVREYIRNQEEHHRHKSWEEECNEFMKAYGRFGQG